MLDSLKKEMEILKKFWMIKYDMDDQNKKAFCAWFDKWKEDLSTRILLTALIDPKLDNNSKMIKSILIIPGKCIEEKGSFGFSQEYSSAGSIIYLTERIPSYKLYELSVYTSLWARRLAIIDWAKRIERHALRAAVAAIMARNMSHNIGSHVLAYLRMEKLIDLFSRIVVKNNNIEGIKNFFEAIQQCASIFSQNNIKQEICAVREQLNNLTSSTTRWGVTEWVKDTRTFFEYLQHRMDFLAQVSTEWPEWTFPAYLMKDIMRYFLMQRHLLDGIAKSEGLRGFYYDWETGYKKYLESVGDKETEECGKIKFHVLNLSCLERGSQSKGDKVKEVWNQSIKNSEAPAQCRITKRIDLVIGKLNETRKRKFLHTKEESEVNIDEGDIQIAIPGGIIGYHAFYVIIENVIRNSAKHSYTKYKDRIKDLEIMIEFTDTINGKPVVVVEKDSEGKTKEVEAYLFRIYDNVSFVEKGTEVCGERFRIFSGDAKEKDKTPENDLVAFMNRCLRHSLIKKETGELDKRHWGMAEMKIAAGYLQGREIQDIGAEDDKITGSEKNQDGDKEDFIIRAVESPIGTLAFEFKVRKPKEVGIVCYQGGRQ